MKRSTFFSVRYFTNYTRRGTPEPQLPVNMYDEGGYSSGWGRKNSERSPWSAPGSAKVFGQGCGAHGGNPNGCIPGNGKCYNPSTYGLDSQKQEQLQFELQIFCIKNRLNLIAFNNKMLLMSPPVDGC